MSKHVLVSVVFLAGCASVGASKNHFATDADVVAFVSMLRREIPPGTSIAAATESMKARGFECQIRRNSSFSADLPDGSHSMTPETIEGIDFIRCTRVDRLSLMVEEVTSVALILSEDAVNDIRINVTGYGP